MSLPRELGLRRTGAGVRLTQRPVGELESLRGERVEPASGTGEYRFQGGGAVEILGLLTPGPDATGTVGLTFEFDGGGVLELSIDYDQELLLVDRSRVDGEGFSPYFGGPSAIPLRELPKQRWPIRIILDRSTIEIFLEDGLVSSTDLIFPPGFLRRFRLSTEGGARGEDLKVYALDSVWK
jgi:sucrose-6-phosphate hydrolase SacC (GH32 family)